jgi:hypothetical protein
MDLKFKISGSGTFVSFTLKLLFLLIEQCASYIGSSSVVHGTSELTSTSMSEVAIIEDTLKVNLLLTDFVFLQNIPMQSTSIEDFNLPIYKEHEYIPRSLNLNSLMYMSDIMSPINS